MDDNYEVIQTSGIEDKILVRSKVNHFFFLIFK